jgi:hypothetical protein
MISVVLGDLSELVILDGIHFLNAEDVGGIT